MFKLIKSLFLLALIAGLAAVGGLWWYAHEPLVLPTKSVDFTVRPGSNVRQIARDVSAAGVKVQPDTLALLARLQGSATNLKAGSYVLEGRVTPLDLIEKMSKGDVTMASVSLIEGWTFRQFRAALDKHANLEHTTAGLTDRQVLQMLADAEQKTLDFVHPEGMFFPDTYLFAKKSKDIEVLRRAWRAMEKNLTQAWEQRASGVPYKTPYEALIMASIVEKETGRASDRPTIAGVFVNRLRKGMLLQTDPTVIYGMGEAYDGNIRKRDLQTDTPYNTYTRGGLPPTPIAMPGLASLAAALNPAPTKAIFFVARGDGTSEFSETLEAHNRAVNKYQRGGK